MSTFRQDIRFAIRSLSKSPAFTSVAVLSLALGIGVNTALFSFADRLLLRSLPVQDPELLTLLDSPGGAIGRSEGAQSFSYPTYKLLRDTNDVFSGVIARSGTKVSVTWKQRTELADGELVTGNYFDVLGLTPEVGRLLSPNDDRVAGEGRVAVLSHGYWMRKFGGDPSVLSQKILVNGQPFEIVGVSPARFDGVLIGRQTEVFVPISMKAEMTPTWPAGLADFRTYFLNVFARLKPGISREQAQTRLEPVYARILHEDTASLPAGIPQRAIDRILSKKLLVLPGFQGRSEIRQQIGKPLLVLMSMVGLVLLIACANLANLLIARAASRQKEIAIRLSLGASRLDLLRQLFTESFVIALAGGTLAVLVAVWAGDVLASYTFDPGAAKPEWTKPDGRVLAFNFGIAIVTALLFGLLPAWKATRTAVATTLKDQAGSVASGAGDVQLRKGLVVAQIALSVLLLFGAALFTRSLQNLRNLDPGFRTDALLTFTIDPSLSGYQKERARAVLDQVRQTIGSLPGVQSVAMTDNAVLSDNQNLATVTIEGYQPKDGENMSPQIAMVGPKYFTSMGTRILAGRDFDERDTADSQPVAIINASFAKKWFPAETPIGRRIRMGRNNSFRTVIGVVADQRQQNMRTANEPMYYFAFLQNDNPGSYTYYVRTAERNTAVLPSAVRREIARISSTIPVFEMRWMDSQVDQILKVERAFSTMSGFFGLLAAALAAIGLYGVMSYTVTRRTKEIGIRMALGAERATVLWLVLREVVIMAAVGLGAGIPVALFFSRYVQGQIYGLRAADPLTMVMAIVAMLLIAGLSGLLPARRAASLDPIRALRYE